MKPNKTEDFWKYVKKTDACWEWMGTVIKNRGGYGYFKIDGKQRRAHRFSWVLAFGEIEGGLFVLHRCDNRRCVRPSHLFLGTHQDNMDDMVRKGRATGCPSKGEAASNAKLNESQVLEIRALKKAGEIYPSIRKKFGIAHHTAWAIVNRKTWTHI